MSSFTGPEISNSGLVLFYDMNNVQKSWKGKPTTNFITNPTEEMARGEFGQYRDLAPIFNTNGLVPYSLSMDIKVNKPGSVLIYMQNGSSSKYSFVNQSVNATTEYQRFYFNNLTPAISNASDTAATLATYTGYGSGVTPTVKNIQLELGSFSTPFVNGTRSNTQSVVDLTGNNTVTASVLTYNSNGSFSFDGSTSYLDCGNNSIIQQSSAITMFSWTKAISSSGLGNILSKNGNSGYRFRIQNEQLWFYVSGNSVIGGSVLNGTWNYCVVTGDSSGLKAYVNGSLVASNTTAFAPAAPASGNLYVGCYSPNVEVFNGIISVAGMYNRALSAQEIQQNFNALRGRYVI